MESSIVARPVWEGRRTALVFAHPGHEVLVHRFLEEARPLVFVLTDGPTLNEEPAIRTTARIVRKTGARVGGIFGRCTTRGLQNALLLSERDRFIALVQELADHLITEEIDLVAGDAAEGIDPAHDLCRVLIDAAVSVAALTRPGLKNFEVPLSIARSNRGAAIRLRVEGDAWLRKFSHCRAYAEPIEEVQQRIEIEGIDFLREECLRLAVPWSIRHRKDIIYSSSVAGRIPALRFREHFLPIVNAVHGFAMGHRSWAA